MNKILLLIGRFQPFHLGHLNIIKRYHSKGFFVKIGIGSAEKPQEKLNPFSDKERENMIKLALNEIKIRNYRIYKIPDTKSHKEWLKKTVKIIGPFDVLFTGNKKVKTLFENGSKKIYYFNESKDRFKGIKANDIRKKWSKTKSRAGLPKSVFLYLKKINTLDRLKEMHDSKKR